MNHYTYKDNLETDRLITRFITIDDIDTWTGFFETEECVKYFPTFGLTTAKARAEHWIKRCVERYSLNLFGLQALIDKETNEFIGQCGLLTQEVDGIKEIEVGYHLLRNHWGKGYATEAGNAFKTYGFQTKQTQSIISIIHIDNIASQKVALRNGMTNEKRTNWNDLDVLIFRAYD